MCLRNETWLPCSTVGFEASAATGHNRYHHVAGTPKWRARHVDEIPPIWLRSAAVHAVYDEIVSYESDFFPRISERAFHTKMTGYKGYGEALEARGPKRVGNTDNCCRFNLQHILVFII